MTCKWSLGGLNLPPGLKDENALEAYETQLLADAIEPVGDSGRLWPASCA